MIRHLVVLSVIGVLIAAPLTLRERPLSPPAGQQRLVILTPHGADIRREFTEAFRDYERREHGVEVDIDWRTPGGTSEITRFMDDRYRAAFAERFPQHRGVKDSFTKGKSPANATPEQSAAQQAGRAAFLASDIGIGADMLFGGGEFAFRSHADKGYAVDTGLIAQEPGWFAGATPVIPQMVSGETVYDKQGRYFGACFGVFGIAYSPERLAELGITVPPRGWGDIAGPAYFGQVTLTDPTKSGAAATTYERILQQSMAATPQDLSAGWTDGFSVIKRLVANSRWITDSASKPTRDAVRGDCVASMAIDFQAKIEGDYATHESGGGERLRFVVPVGGTSVSSDPIAVLRGAPNRALAAEFLHFVLSPAGQRLWSQRVGTPGGPLHTALRRYPVRRDLLGPEQRDLRSDPDEDPFAIAAGFTYHREWTGRYFLLITSLVKSIALDPRQDLTAAWAAINAAGGPDKVPEAWAQFCWLPVDYTEAAAISEKLDQLKQQDPVQVVQLQRSWLEQSTIHFQLAAALAEAGR